VRESFGRRGTRDEGPWKALVEIWGMFDVGHVFGMFEIDVLVLGLMLIYVGIFDLSLVFEMMLTQVR